MPSVREHRRPRWPVPALAALLVSVPVVAAPPDAFPDDVQSAARSVQGRRIAGRVRFLASEFMEGREAGTRGERLAAEYIRDFYMGLGLAPAGESGSYYQTFELHRKSLGPDNRLEVVRLGEKDGVLALNVPLDTGFLPFVFSPSGEVEAPVVFAGYGIRAPEYGYDDYAGLDVRGAAVLVLRHEPRENDPDSPFKGLRSTRHAAFLSKVRLAQSLGAAAVLVVTDPLNHEPDRRRPGNSLARWASLVERSEFDTRPPPDPYTFYPEIAPDVRIPAAHIGWEAADALAMADGLDLEEAQRRLDEGLKSVSRPLAGARVRLRTDIRTETVPVRNVAAMLRGSDPSLRDEVVIVGGHYDHVGYGHFGSVSGAWGRIHPGADDNASGTAAILSAAEALASLDPAPPRSILFLHFTAEEKGLMGSRWFTTHPTVDLTKVVAMLNLDMVGRNEPRVLSLVGDRRAAPLDALVKTLGSRELGLELNNDAGSGVDRSDHWAFAIQGIPALSFFSGVHDDYHRPQDTASKIVPEKLENVTRLAVLTLWTLAQQGREALAAGEAP